MAKGSQDWVDRTDLLLQTLDEIVQRPRYGAQGMSTVTGNVIPLSTTPVIDIVGAGMLWAIYFWASSTGPMANDLLDVTVDGELMETPTFGQFFQYNFLNSNPQWAFGTVYDTINNIIAGGQTVNYSFDAGFRLAYNETYGRSPLAYAKVVYSLW